MRGTVLYGTRDVRFEEVPDQRSPSQRMPSYGSRRHVSADRTCGAIAVLERSTRSFQTECSGIASLRRYLACGT